MQIVQIATYFLSSLTVLAQIATILLVIALLVPNHTTKKMLKIVAKQALLLAFLIALTATLGSLFFSEIAGFEPCKLCWYQRILMYPQVLLLGLAYWKKDKYFAKYSILLSLPGALIALYHYLLQNGVVGEILPCSAVGYSVSCAKKFVLTFGYISIPLMAFSAFLLILLLMIIQKKQMRTEKKVDYS